MAHIPILRHANQGGVDHRFTVGMVTLHGFADDTSTLTSRRIGPKAEIMHCNENTPLRRFQSITSIGQGPTDDNAHGVSQVAFLHLICNIQRHCRGHFWNQSIIVGRKRVIRQNCTFFQSNHTKKGKLKAITLESYLLVIILRKMVGFTTIFMGLFLHLFVRFFLPPTLCCGTIIVVLVLAPEMLFYSQP